MGPAGRVSVVQKLWVTAASAAALRSRRAGTSLCRKGLGFRE